MMIKCKLRILMAEKNINMSELSKKINISRITIAKLYNDKAKTYNHDMLQNLCSFFDCKVSDILEYIPDKVA